VEGIRMSTAEAESRALNAAENDMVNGTRSPAIEQKTKDELKALVHRLRQAHSRANDISTRQQREMRGKAEPHGAKRARENAGTVLKAQMLFEAIQRVDHELSRREEVETGRPSQTELARRALELKNERRRDRPSRSGTDRIEWHSREEAYGRIRRRRLEARNGPRLPGGQGRAGAQGFRQGLSRRTGASLR
jgi:hypothetical protein